MVVALSPPSPSREGGGAIACWLSHALDGKGGLLWMMCGPQCGVGSDSSVVGVRCEPVTGA